MANTKRPVKKKKAASKKKAHAKKGPGRRPKKRASRPKIDRASLVSSTVDEWFNRLRESSILAESTGKPKGACMVSDPAGGASMCVFTDRDTCKAIKGTFLGGPC
jgi:hypothetical protein